MSERCLVMGIVNRTPDSFYDGGRMGLEESVEHAVRLVDEGADILDIGAVKAGPGDEVEVDEEVRRLLPLVEAVAQRVEVDISIETARASVAEKALQAGASIVNDVTELADRDLASVCVAAGARLVIMHHGGQIRGRPRHPRYSDIVGDVKQTWERVADRARAAGLDDRSIIVDPGLDFGKTTFHSLELIRRLDELVDVPWPVLVAPSRKDVVGETLGLPLEQRLEGTLALVALSVARGAAIVRVHDVTKTVRVVKMIEATEGRRAPAAPVRGLWD
jgi:dihydropteroate synthase